MTSLENAVDPRPHILNFDEPQLREWLKEHNYPAFRAGQLLGWIYQRRAESFEAMSDLPKAMRVELEQSFRLWTADIAAHQQADDGTEKLLLRLADGGRIECVLASRRDAAFDLCEQSSWLRDGLCVLREWFGWR